MSGPKDTTIGAFWRMVWQEDVRTVIMTTGLMEGTKQKCARYWPQGNVMETPPLCGCIDLQ